jgi:protocatechuate 3,4-dioxygenase beta subunit
MKKSRRKFITWGSMAGAMGAAIIYLPKWIFSTWDDRTTTTQYQFPASPVVSKVSLLPTPPCEDGDVEATPALTAGPFYTPNTPERSVLYEPGMAGTPLVVIGRVLTTDCQPVGGAVLDFWQADGNGNYDNKGFTLRVHQFTDSQGYYRLETVQPGLYPGRTPHIHVKVQGKATPLLTTQLYFPGQASNKRDNLYKKSLEVNLQALAGGKMEAQFDFVLST